MAGKDPRMISRIGNSGFTLIEVLVASVILFAGLGAVLKAYSMAVSALDSAEDIVASSLLFHDQMAALELQAVDGAAPPPSSSGSTLYHGVAYKWEARVRLQPVSPDLEVQSVLIRASRARGGGLPRTVECEWPVFKDLETRTSNIQQ